MALKRNLPERDSVYFESKDPVVVGTVVGFIKRKNMTKRSINAFLTKHKAGDKYVGSEHFPLMGIFFKKPMKYDDPIPAGWRRQRRETYFVPDRSTPKGKEIAKEITAINTNAKSAYDVTKQLGFNQFAGMRVAHLGFIELSPEHVLLEAYEGMAPKPLPKGIKEIKASRFHLLKEKAGIK